MGGSPLFLVFFYGKVINADKPDPCLHQVTGGISGYERITGVQFFLSEQDGVICPQQQAANPFQVQCLQYLPVNTADPRQLKKAGFTQQDVGADTVNSRGALDEMSRRVDVGGGVGTDVEQRDVA